MQVVPDETTALISRLCTDWLPDGTPTQPSAGICVCVCVCACVRACVRACVCAAVHCKWAGQVNVYGNRCTIKVGGAGTCLLHDV